MPEISRQTNATNMIWKAIDRQTGDENASTAWAFAVGDRGEDSTGQRGGVGAPDAPPFHIHGAGRYWSFPDVSNPGVDGSLPHCGKQPERDDVQLRRSRKPPVGWTGSINRTQRRLASPPSPSAADRPQSLSILLARPCDGRLRRTFRLLFCHIPPCRRGSSLGRRPLRLSHGVPRPSLAAPARRNETFGRWNEVSHGFTDRGPE